jgi:sphinganine-1-phosphate aldolase
MIDFSKFIQANSLPLLVISNLVTASVGLYFVSEGQPIKFIKRKLIAVALAVVPSNIVEKELDKTRKQVEDDVIGKSLDGLVRYQTLPDEGWSEEQVSEYLSMLSKRDYEKTHSGKISGAIYRDGLEKIMARAFEYYCMSNPLHPDLFASLRKMEAEVVAMTLEIFHGTKEQKGDGVDGTGVVTSGGTESILLAVKTYRDIARKYRGVTEPELIISSTAHAAFDKACEFFNVKLIKVPADPVTFKADVRAMERAISSSTIALVGSAPSFPQGVLDPIEDLAAVARKFNLPLHVDACLGSFLIAFSEEAGFPLPRFDFRVPGVTSISADTHKYGYAPKGSSVLMYSSPFYRHEQYFVVSQWTGGIYASPTIAGSRPGALIASCWAVMMAIGKAGYKVAAKRILSVAQKVSNEVESIQEITLFGKPDLSIICIGARSTSSVNIYAVVDALKEKGWNLNSLQNPACFHLCITFANVDTVEACFVKELREAVEEVRSNPAKFKHGTSAIYGMSGSMPTATIAQVCNAFLDALYKA